MRRRVVITGLGLLSSAGRNVEEARRHFVAGNCCLTPITDPRAAHLKARYAGLLIDFDPAPAGLPPGAESWDRHVVMALVAARETLAHAGVAPPERGRRLGLVFGTCSGPMLSIERHYARLVAGRRELSADEFLAKQYYTGAQLLAGALDIRGPVYTVVTACTAGTAAIALATDLIRCGMLDAALAGGADAFATSTLAGFDGLKATSEGRCAPFSKPFGLNLGEAAAFVFLESAAAAHSRGVTPRAEIAGSGTSNDAYHCSAPEPTGRGLALAMQRAFLDAGIGPEGITFINAHGTGTEANDKAEVRAIRKVFGDRAATVRASSTKSLVGHCLGAAGVVETIATLACAEAGVLPPTANFAGAREGCALDCVPEPGRPWPAPHVFLKTNLAFGGHNASLILSPAEPATNALPEASPRGSTGPEPVWVTALGVVSDLGLGAPAFREALRAGRSGLSPVSLPEAGIVLAGLIDEAAVARADRRLDLKNMDRSSRWATLAARLALREAGYPEEPRQLAELGLFLSLATGPSWAESEYLTSLFRHNHQVSQLVAFPYIVPCSVTGNVCRALRLTGHNLTLSLGPGAGLLGLGPALAALQSGHGEAMLSGAVDELSDRILSDRLLAGLLTPETPPPAEGAAMLLLETARHARERGAPPLAQLCSTAASAAGTGTSGLAETVREALGQAEARPEQVGAWCGQTSSPEVKGLLAGLCPAWAGRQVDVTAATGRLDATQPLLDLAAVLAEDHRLPVEAPFILCFSSHHHSGTAAAVFRTSVMAP